jgi:hypothetical protein
MSEECFGCRADNPSGLQLEILSADDRSATRTTTVPQKLPVDPALSMLTDVAVLPGFAPVASRIDGVASKTTRLIAGRTTLGALCFLDQDGLAATRHNLISRPDWG